MPDARHHTRPRLNWFAPLPPAHTDIAHYTMRTVPALSRHFDVVVWTERRYWPPELESHAVVRRWDGAAWTELHRADTTLYHFGNNVRFHGWIWDVARRCPGIVVLHDTRLHEFFAGLLLESGGGPPAYLAAVRRCHGDAAVIDAARFLRRELPASALAEAQPLTELALERARGAIVHTATAWREISQAQRCSVLQLELPYPAGAPAPRRTWDGVLKLVVFGYISANRRIDALLEAIASFPERRRLSLEIFGELSDAGSLAEQVQGRGLDDIVRVAGFVPETELDQALDRAHLAVNLRYPTMGEASGSQLRIWSRALASVVSRTGWYAELPAETVGFVDPANEIADLHEHFRHALANPDALRRMGDAGRRYLEEHHDPAAYARELSVGVERMMRTPVSILGELGSLVGGTLARSGIPGAAKAAVAQRVAEELCRWLALPPDRSFSPGEVDGRAAGGGVHLPRDSS